MGNIKVNDHVLRIDVNVNEVRLGKKEIKNGDKLHRRTKKCITDTYAKPGKKYTNIKPGKQSILNGKNIVNAKNHENICICDIGRKKEGQYYILSFANMEKTPSFANFSSSIFT